MIKYMYLLIFMHTLLQTENLDSEENIIVGGDFNCPLNPTLHKRWNNHTKEIGHEQYRVFTK